MKHFRKKSRGLVIAFALLCAAGVTLAQNTEWCEYYRNSSTVDFGGEYGFACAGTGAGCWDCGEVIDVEG